MQPHVVLSRALHSPLEYPGADDDRYPGNSDDTWREAPSGTFSSEDPKQTGAGLMESRRSDGIRIQDNNRRFSERMVFTSEDTP